MDSKRNEEELVQIFVDADACPEVGIVEIIAKEHNVVIWIRIMSCHQIIVKLLLLVQEQMQ